MKIAVTGYGLISAIGNDRQETLESIRKQRSGIGKMVHLESSHREIPVGEVRLSDDEMKGMLGIPGERIVSRTSLLGAVALKQAMADAGYNPETLNGKRVTLISGTTVGGMDVTERYFTSLKTDDRYLGILARHDCGSNTQEIAEICGLQCEVCTISTACSSALNALILGSEMLKAGETDIVIAGGSEALSRFHLNGFNTLMILDKETCRPFDATRAGLNLGEGAAFIVLERESSNARAYISGYGNRCDAFHQTATSENGEGAFLAMTDALSMAGLQPQDIDYVNAHGTATPNNDLSESAALKRVFGEGLPPVSSTKGFTGHTTSASGSIEAAICLIAMEESLIPANIGWREQMAEGITPCMGMVGKRLRHVACNAFGFGGNDSCLVISAAEPATDVAGTGKETAETRGETAETAAERDAEKRGSVIVSDVTVDGIEGLGRLREFVPPMQMRRMGKLMKAATLASLLALKEAGVERPDAIITGTAYGMLETSEVFLNEMTENGEEGLSPTLFMQSTHNTLSSAIAIRTHCHGYNITYCQGSESLDWALRDARRLIETGKAETVLVGMHDESTEMFREWCQRAGMAVPPVICSRAMVLRRI